MVVPVNKIVHVLVTSADVALVTGEFLLRLADLCGEVAVAYDPHRNGHERVVLAAEFGTLTVEHPYARRLEPSLIDAARNCIDLDVE